MRHGPMLEPRIRRFLPALLALLAVVCDSQQRAPSIPCHTVPSVRITGAPKTSSVRACTGTYKYRANDEDTGRPFYYDSRSKNYMFYVRELGAWAVGRHPGQPPFCLTRNALPHSREPASGGSGVWSTLATVRGDKGSSALMQPVPAPYIRASLVCADVTPAPTPLLLATLSPTPRPTVPPTPSPTPPLKAKLCPTVVLHGDNRLHWIPHWCDGPFSLQKNVEYGGLPVYGRDVTRGACHIYYNTQSKMWVLGGAIGSPPFYMFVKVRNIALEWAPWRVDGTWAAFNHKTHHFVSLKKVSVQCVAPTPFPTQTPTAAPSPAPTPTPLLPRDEWCDRVELRCTECSAAQAHYTGWYDLDAGLHGRPSYTSKPLKAASNATLHLYFDHPYGEWVISLRKFAPPFFFIARTRAAAPDHIAPGVAWEHFDGTSYHKVPGASISCPVPTPVPTPGPSAPATTRRPTSSPTPKPTPALWTLCRYLKLTGSKAWMSRAGALDGIFGLQRSKVAHRPAYALIGADKSTIAWLYYHHFNLNNGAGWVVSAQIGSPPWLLVARSEAYVPYGLARNEHWTSFDQSRAAYVRINGLQAQCSAPPSNLRNAVGGGADKFVWARGPVPWNSPHACRAMYVAGVARDQPGGDCVGPYMLQNMLYADRPLYWSNVTYMSLYYRSQFGQWVVSHKLGKPPFLLVAASTVDEPSEIKRSGAWSAFSTSQGDFVNAPNITVTCHNRGEYKNAMPHHGIATNGRSGPIWETVRQDWTLAPTPPTPVPSPFPTPAPTRFCEGIFLSGSNVAKSLLGWYSLSSKQVNGRAHYISATSMHMYYRATNKLWAVSRGINVPPFLLVARDETMEPLHVSWMALRADAGASMSSFDPVPTLESSCPEPTPAPTPIPTPAPTPKPQRTFETCILQRALGDIPPGFDRYRAIVIRRSVMVALRITPNDGTLTIVSNKVDNTIVNSSAPLGFQVVEELVVCLSLRMRRLALALQPLGALPTFMQTSMFRLRLRKLLHADKRMGFLGPAPTIWAREVFNATVKVAERNVIEALRAKAATYAGEETALDGSAGRGSSLGYGVVLLAATLSLMCAPSFSGLSKTNDIKDYDEQREGGSDFSDADEAVPLKVTTNLPRRTQHRYSGRAGRYSDTTISFDEFPDGDDSVYAATGIGVGVSTSGFTDDPDSPC